MGEHTTRRLKAGLGGMALALLMVAMVVQQARAARANATAVSG